MQNSLETSANDGEAEQKENRELAIAKVHGSWFYDDVWRLVPHVGQKFDLVLDVLFSRFRLRCSRGQMFFLYSVTEHSFA